MVRWKCRGVRFQSRPRAGIQKSGRCSVWCSRMQDNESQSSSAVQSPRERRQCLYLMLSFPREVECKDEVGRQIAGNSARPVEVRRNE